MQSNGRVALQPGFILHRRPYRDSSLLVEAFTRDFGRIGLVARGAQRPRSTLQGMLQPFQPLLFSWAGRGELWTLQGAEPGGRPRPLFGDALLSGFYLNELLLRLLHRHDAHPELYAAYGRCVGELQLSHREWSIRLFERELLDALGYGLLLTEDAATGEPLRPEQRYCYHLENGPVAAGADSDGLHVTGRTLLALHQGQLPDGAALAESKRLMRAALRLYLGDRPLASRELFRQHVQRTREATNGGSEE